MAKKPISELNVALTATTTPFKNKLKDVTRDVARTETRMQGFASKLRGTFTKLSRGAIGGLASGIATVVKSMARLAAFAAGAFAVGIAAAAAALAALTIKAFDAIDSQGKVAAKLGLTTEALAALRLAASEAGVGTSALDTGLQRMTRRVAEAAKGTGEARGALQELGLDAKKLAALAPDKQFERIAEALSKVKSQGEKVRLGFKLFDTEGVALINLGVKGIRDAHGAVETLGLKISDIDTARIESMNDAVARVKLSFKGIGQQIAIKVAPIIEGLSRRILQFIEVSGGIPAIVDSALSFASGKFIQFGKIISTAMLGGIVAINGMREGVLDFVSIGAGKFPAFANAVTAAFKIMKLSGTAAFNGLKVVVLGLLTAIGGLVNSAVKLFKMLAVQINKVLPKKFQINIDTSGIDAFVRSLATDTAAASKAWLDALSKIPGEASKLLNATNTLISDNIRSTFVDELVPQVEAALDKIQTKLEELNKDGAGGFAGIKEKIAQIRRDAEAISALSVGPPSTPEGANASLEPLGAMSKKAQEAAEATAATIQQLRSSVESSMEGFTRAIIRGGDVMEGLRDLAASVVEDLIAEFVKLSIIKPLLNAIFGAFVGGVGIGGGGGPIAAIGNVIGGLFGEVPEFANGSPALATATPTGVAAVGKSFGESPVIIQIDASGSDPGAVELAVERGIRRAEPRLVERAVFETSRRRSRDPAFRGAGA